MQAISGTDESKSAVEEEEITPETMQFLMSWIGADGGGKAGIVFGISVSIIAGLGEELLFRGVVQGLLQRFTSAPVAVAISAAVFGALHSVSPMYAVKAGLIGVYFSVLLCKTNNLAVPIISHALWDTLVFVFFRNEIKEQFDAAKASSDVTIRNATSISNVTSDEPKMKQNH
jgi:membrane protease YdiL (CAAX protease family)